MIELATGKKCRDFTSAEFIASATMRKPAAELGSDPRMHDAGVTFEARRAPGTAPPWSDWWNRPSAGESPDADPAPGGGSRQVNTRPHRNTAATVPPSGESGNAS